MQQSASTSFIFIFTFPQKVTLKIETKNLFLKFQASHHQPSTCMQRKAHLSLRHVSKLNHYEAAPFLPEDGDEAKHRTPGYQLQVQVSVLGMIFISVTHFHRNARILYPVLNFIRP